MSEDKDNNKGKNNVVSLATGKEPITPSVLFARLPELKRCVVIGESNDSAPVLAVSDGYDTDELIIQLERYLFWLKCEVFGIPDFDQEEFD